MKLGRVDEARFNFEMAVHYNPKSDEFWFKLCNAFLHLGKRDKAEGCFRKVLSVNATHSNAALQLASLLTDNQTLPARLQEAEKMCVSIGCIRICDLLSNSEHFACILVKYS